MQFQPVPAQTFYHSMIALSPDDRITRLNSHFIPVRAEKDGYILRNEADANQEVFVGNQQLYDEAENAISTIHYGYNSIGQQRLRDQVGNKTMSDFSPERQQMAYNREKIIHLFEEECRASGKVPRGERLKQLLREWHDVVHPEIELAEPLRADVTAKVVTTKTKPLSVKTFYREYTDYCDCDRNPVALAPRHHGPGKKLFNTNPEAVAFAHKHALGYLDRLKPSKADVYRRYRAALHKHNRGRPVALIHVSRKKFESMIAKFDQYTVLAAREGESFAIKKLRGVRQSFDFIAPGQRGELDTWSVDMMSFLSETGILNYLPIETKEVLPTGRIYFTAIIDVATRYVLAFKATMTPTSDAVVAAIRMMMSDKRHISSYVNAQTPWIGKIKPTGFGHDNGSENIGEPARYVLAAARIPVTRPAAGDPKARPFVESLFHTLGPLLAPYFDGRTFGSIEEKGDYDPADHATLVVDELIKVFTLGICDIYHNKPHSGLGGNTPHNAWVEGAKQYRHRYPPNAAEMLQIFGQRDTRTMGAYGVTVMGITYDNDELQRLRGERGLVEVEVKYDLECAAYISVRGDKGWFLVRNTIGLDETVTLPEWVAARKQLLARNAAAAAQGMGAMYDAINRLRASGEAATLRANLSPRTPNADDINRWQSEFFGLWRVPAEENLPGLINDLTIQDDPITQGSVAPSPMISALSKTSATAPGVVQTKATAPTISDAEQDSPVSRASSFHFEED